MENLIMNDITLPNQSTTKADASTELLMADSDRFDMSDPQPTDQDTHFRDSPAPLENTSDIQDVVHMEEAGFFGFESMDEVRRYLEFKDQGFIESVIIVEPYGPHNAARVQLEARESFLAIPTRLRGYVVGILPEQSPHAKDVASFVARQSNTSNDAYTSTNTSIPMMRTGFADWWMHEGGKFHVIAMDNSLEPGHPDTFQATNTNAYMPMVAATPYQIITTDSYNTDNKRRGTAVAKPGMYKYRTPPKGALRIWGETGVDRTPAFMKWDRHEHFVFSHAPVYTVDLRLLADVYVTAHELLTWFPDHLAFWPDYVYRFASSGWTISEIVKCIYVVRGMTSMASKDIHDMVERDRSRLSHYRARLGLTPAGQQQAKQAPQLYTDLTCANWAVPDSGDLIGPGSLKNLIDYHVSDLAEGVLVGMYPTDEHAGILTDIIRLIKGSPDDPECQALKAKWCFCVCKEEGTVSHSGSSRAVNCRTAYSNACRLCSHDRSPRICPPPGVSHF